jgi:hypothetical protein
MASSLDDIAWDSFVHQGGVKTPSKGFQRPISQPVPRSSPSDVVKVPESRDWFSSPRIKPVKPAGLALSPRRHASNQNLPSNLPNEPHLSSPRDSQRPAYVTRPEVLLVMRRITDRLDGLQDALNRLNELQDK